MPRLARPWTADERWLLSMLLLHDRRSIAACARRLNRGVRDVSREARVLRREWCASRATAGRGR